MIAGILMIVFAEEIEFGFFNLAGENLKDNN